MINNIIHKNYFKKLKFQNMFIKDNYSLISYFICLVLNIQITILLTSIKGLVFFGGRESYSFNRHWMNNLKTIMIFKNFLLECYGYAPRNRL